MRLWTLHPKYLDAVGLVALWREALLAREVIRGNTRGYRFHPQLAAPRGQLRHEWNWLLDKLRHRSVGIHERMRDISTPDAHPLFAIVDGPVCTWERLRP